MKMKTLCFVVCILFLLHAAAHVESRRHHDDRKQQPSYKLFVFGDDFADNGNVDKHKLNQWSRSWYKPYGVSNDRRPTGRFSDGKLQSDFIAMILGYDESPAPENSRQDRVDPFGMNFAVSFAGVTDRTPASSLDKQIGQFRRLLNHGLISDDLDQSVALVAFSGYDYYFAPDGEKHHDRLVSFVDDVTDSIVDGVKQILGLGVTKVLVNMQHPLGCTPRYTRLTGKMNYTECIKDYATDLHNRKIKEKLGTSESVLLLDLKKAFTSILDQKTGEEFLHRYIPCCISDDADGYCGQVDSYGVQKFEVCDNPERYFYFDDWHPTQAGWEAVIMDKLGDDIKEFLGISI